MCRWWTTTCSWIWPVARVDRCWRAIHPRLSGRPHPYRRAATARHRCPLPLPGSAGQDRVAPGRAVGRACNARHRHRRGVVRARARRSGRAVPAAHGTVRTARGDAADRAPDVERGERAVRRPALPARGDPELAAAAERAPSAGHGRLGRGEEDAAVVTQYADACNLFAGRPGAGPGEIKAKLEILRARLGSDFDGIRKSMDRSAGDHGGRRRGVRRAVYPQACRPRRTSSTTAS